MNPTSAAEAVANGAQWLDEQHPGWWRKLDLETLDLEDCANCVCGQLARTSYAQERSTYRGYLKAYSEVLGFDAMTSLSTYPSPKFLWGYDELDEEWGKVICARLEADKLCVVEEVLQDSKQQEEVCV